MCVTCRTPPARMRGCSRPPPARATRSRSSRSRTGGPPGGWTGCCCRPPLRRLVEDAVRHRGGARGVLGAPGYTPGLAQRADRGGRPADLPQGGEQEGAAARSRQAYAEEIRKLRSLPRGLPVPRLLWTHEDDLWVVLALEHVDGRQPRPALAAATSSTRAWTRLRAARRRADPAADARCARSPRSSPTWSAAGTTSGDLARTGRTSRRPPRSPRGSPAATAGNTAGAHRRPRRQLPAPRRRAGLALRLELPGPSAPRGSTPSAC